MELLDINEMFVFSYNNVLSKIIDGIQRISDIGTWRSIVELNFGTNQIQKLPDDIALLENLEVRIIPSHIH